MIEVHTIDLSYLDIPEALAAYLVIGGPPGRPVLIETGPASTLASLERGLAEHGVRLDDVGHALVTHIHLDHAGAAGALAQRGVTIHVHEFGARHLADPSRLIESATRIYGDQMQRLWGRVLPVPQEQIAPAHAGDILTLDELRFTVIETAGHARHHHAFALDLGGRRVCFTGDAGGIVVPDRARFNSTDEPAFISVPTPPPEFDLGAWLASIERMDVLRFDALYPTHFGRVSDPAAHFRKLRGELAEHVEFVRRALDRGLPREAILRDYIDWNHQRGRSAGFDIGRFNHYVSRNLLTMNVDGMVRYWSKRREGAPIANS